jgi:hypothetical protein
MPNRNIRFSNDPTTNDGMKRISSVMSLTTSAGAILGLAGSLTWLAIRLALSGMPKDFFGEGFGWAILFVGISHGFRRSDRTWDWACLRDV